jgi:hypothetical protein
MSMRSSGLSTLKKGQAISPSAEVFADYYEEHEVWKDLCEAIFRRHALDDPSLNFFFKRWI